MREFGNNIENIRSEVQFPLKNTWAVAIIVNNRSHFNSKGSSLELQLKNLGLG